MATNNQNLIGVPLDARTTYIDSIELRVRGKLDLETYIRAIPDSATQIPNMPPNSDWDWHPAQIRFLVKSSQIRGPQYTVASSYKTRNFGSVSTIREVRMIELRVRDQPGYEMYIRATPNSDLQDLDMPSSNDWDWHAAQVRLLNKKPQVLSRAAPIDLAEPTRTSFTNSANSVERRVRSDSRYNSVSLVASAGTSGRKLSLQDVSLNYLCMELKLRRFFSVDSASTEYSFPTHGIEGSKTNVGSLLIFEDVLDVIDGRWGRELYELQLESTVGGDSIKLDSIPESLAFISSNDDVVKTIFWLKPCYLELNTHISVRFRYDTSELIFSMVAASKFEILFKVACELWQVSCGKVRFFLNGCRVTGDETPESIEMEDEDVIEAYLELVGGRPTRQGYRRGDRSGDFIKLDDSPTRQRCRGDVRSAGYIVPSIEGASNAIIPDAQGAVEERLSESYPVTNPNITKSNDGAATENELLFLRQASRDELLGTPEIAGGKQPQDQRGITIKVKNDTESEIFLKVMPHTRFSVIMKACEKHWDKENLRFFSPDGQRILPDDTPETLDLEDGDQISALIHAWGGC